MKKKIRARAYIEGYEDPVKGCTCDIRYDGTDAEIIAILLRCAVDICRRDLQMSDNQIIGLFTGCVEHDR